MNEAIEAILEWVYSCLLTGSKAIIGIWMLVLFANLIVSSAKMIDWVVKTARRAVQSLFDR